MFHQPSDKSDNVSTLGTKKLNSFVNSKLSKCMMIVMMSNDDFDIMLATGGMRIY